MKRLRVLVGCEFSGIVRDAFRERGHDAWSCDLLPSERPGPHIQGDVLEVLGDGWDLMIAHPPCTHLCVSGAKHFAKKRADGRQDAAAALFMEFVNAPIGRIAVENPVGIMSSRYRQPDQIIQPWMFGDEATKTTCLWLKNLPHLGYDEPLFAKPTIVGRGARHVTKGGNSLPEWYNIPPSDPNRSNKRSTTFPGIAAAMADQWGGIP